jgi:hypothetical protein
VTDPACSLAPSHELVELAVQQANVDAAIASPVTGSSLVQLQRETAGLWSYRTNPE